MTPTSIEAFDFALPDVLSFAVMKTLLHHLYEWSNETPQAQAQFWKTADGWKSLSVHEYVDRVEALARYLFSEGVTTEDVGLIYSYNSPEWVQMDLAFTLVGAASAGIYVNASARQIHYILKHSQAKILVVEDVAAIKRIFADQDPQAVAADLRRIVVLKTKPQETLPTWALSFAEALRIGQDVSGPRFHEWLDRLEPDRRAVLIYTSGTTGQPKAVSLSHTNLVFAANCYADSWEAPADGRLFSFLPLAHIAERMVNLGLAIKRRYAVYFCSSPLAIAGELREVQPTVLLCVPRLWDKLKEGVEAKIAAMPVKTQRKIRWAMAVSKEYESLALRNKPRSLGLRLKRAVADRLILRKIREQLGLSKLSRAASGAAALSPSTLEWYRGIGVRIVEAYALSESAGILTCGRGDVETAFTVGVPYPGIEIRLASDGEIEARGPNVFQGYFKDEAATAEVLCEGWLKTGDIGAFDEQGFLKILGRKREIIKNAEGKMISPLFLEAQILASPLIDQAIVIGNERPYLVALVTLAETVRVKPGRGSVVDHSSILGEIERHIATINREVASHERIKSFRVLSRSFSIEHDEMTATMKLKRAVIEGRHQNLIEHMYDRRENQVGSPAVVDLA